jgi:heme-degrading monooxygenase HmoA/uncharacterized protein YndB with AHSA1/START domain
MLVFVNDFRVHGDCAAFEAAFSSTSDYFGQQPGFVGHRLVRSAADSRRYVNIAEWADRESFERALADPAFAPHARALRELAASEPKICEEVMNRAAGRYPPIKKYVTVPATQQQAFAFFAEHPLEWQPPRHVLVKAPREAIFIEPWVGGRWYERAVDGTQADWGSVRAWDPPRGLVLSWRIDGTWQPVDDEAKASEIAVEFQPDGASRTVVSVEHRCLEAHGEHAAAIHRALQGPSPGDTLAQYAKAIAVHLEHAVTVS